MIVFPAESGSFIPTLAQHQLLRAALLDDRSAVQSALENWKRAVPFDDMDVAQLRLMPLLYANLRRLGIGDPLIPRMKGIYRQTWFRNQLILDQGKIAVSRLRSAGIEVLLIKGGALVTSIYSDPALRPMEDFDIVVPRADFHRAAHALMEIGWKIHPTPIDPEPHLDFHHAVSMRRDGAGELDLHWATMFGYFDREGEEEFWRGSREISLGGHSVRVLAPPDQLLQLCAHATHRNFDVAPIRWVADAYRLLGLAPVFDWARLIRLARMRSLSLMQLRALEYLRDGLGIHVPEDVVRALHHNVRRGEAFALRLRGAGRSGQRWYAAWIWTRLVFLDGFLRVPRRLRLLRRYLRSAFRIPDGVSLFRFVFGRIVRGPVAPGEVNRDTSQP